jgi:hypothetical protein
VCKHGNGGNQQSENDERDCYNLISHGVPPDSLRGQFPACAKESNANRATQLTGFGPYITHVKMVAQAASEVRISSRKLPMRSTGTRNQLGPGAQLRGRSFFQPRFDYKRCVMAGRDLRALRTRSGVNGISRKRTPVASKMALAMAAGTTTIGVSAAPVAGSSGRLIN